jgi:hypothetical protein
MTYQASIHLDTMSGANRNAYTRLLNALDQAGWEYVETSAMALIDGSWPEVLEAFELLARGLPAVGGVSSLAVQVQLTPDDHVARKPPGAANHSRARRNILGLPLPSGGR